MYDTKEQSRKPRVKCCQNGELSDRRRIRSAMRYPHPLRHNGLPPLWKAILGRANGLAYTVLSCRCVYGKIAPLVPLHEGFVFSDTYTKGKQIDLPA